MKIINKEEFLKLSENILYSKYESCNFSGLFIKYDTLDNDFLYVSIIDAIECNSSDDYFDKLFSAVKNKRHLTIDFDNCVRDGMFDDKQLFAVWEKEDIMKLIEVLNKCLRNN